MTMDLTLRLAAAEEWPLLARLNRELAEDVDWRRPLPEPEYYEHRMRELLAEGYRAALFYLEKSPGGPPISESQKEMGGLTGFRSLISAHPDQETSKPTHALEDSRMGGPPGLEPAAFALFIDHGDEIYLRMFLVRRDCRRRGVGRAAMRMLIDRIWPRDRRLTVDTFANNASALAFWRSLGYRDYQVVLRMEAGER